MPNGTGCSDTFIRAEDHRRMRMDLDSAGRLSATPHHLDDATSPMTFSPGPSRASRHAREMGRGRGMRPHVRGAIVHRRDPHDTSPVMHASHIPVVWDVSLRHDAGGVTPRQPHGGTRLYDRDMIRRSRRAREVAPRATASGHTRSP